MPKIARISAAIALTALAGAGAAFADERWIGGLDGWAFDLECQSGRSVYDETVMGFLEGRDVLWWFHGTFEPVRFTRCKDG